MSGSAKTSNEPKQNAPSTDAATKKLEANNLYLQHQVNILRLEMSEMNEKLCTNANDKNKLIREGDKYDDNAEKLRKRLLGTIVAEKPDIKWDDIAGLKTLKETLDDAIKEPQKHPEMYTGSCKAPKGILMFGPPGNGKTLIAKAVAAEAQASTFFSVKSSNLISKWLGDSEGSVNQLFELARKHKPSIIFIDEVDGLCSVRSDNENDATLRIKNEFLVQMGSMDANNENVLVLGATNRPWAIDRAFMRRFPKKIYVPLPDLHTRFELFKLSVEKNRHTLTDEDYWTLAEHTEGYSAHDISQIVEDAAVQRIRKTKIATHFKEVPSHNNPTITQHKTWMPCSPDDEGAKKMSYPDLDGERVELPPLTMRDVTMSLREASPIVNQADLDKFEKFKNDLGDPEKKPPHPPRFHPKPEKKSKVSNCIMALRAIYAVLQVMMFLSAAIGLFTYFSPSNRINNILVVLYLLATVIVAFICPLVASDRHSMRQTWLVLLEGVRHVIAASLFLVLLLSGEALLSIAGSFLCFLFPTSIILFMILQIVYWLYPKHKADKKSAKADEVVV